MIPSAFLVLERLPRTPNGKVDRRSLPAPERTHGIVETPYAAPQTDAEKAIAAIWCELLRVEKVGAHDNFFDLGGHSLLLVQAHALLRHRLGIDVPVIKLFQYPTISALAAFVSKPQTKVSFQKIFDRARRQREALARPRAEEVQV